MYWTADRRVSTLDIFLLRLGTCCLRVAKPMLTCRTLFRSRSFRRATEGPRAEGGDVGLLRLDRDPSVDRLGAILATVVVVVLAVVNRKELLFEEAEGLDNTVSDAISPIFLKCKDDTKYYNFRQYFFFLKF